MWWKQENDLEYCEGIKFKIQKLKNPAISTKFINKREKFNQLERSFFNLMIFTMLFYQEYIFKTEYRSEELIKIVKEMKKSSDKRIWQFEGITTDNTFTLSPIFYSGHEYRFRPEIHGVIVPNLTESKIFLKLRISISYRILLYSMLILNSFIWFWILYERRNIEIKFIDLRVGYPIAGLIVFTVLLIEFYQNGNRAVQILIDKLKLKKI